MTHENSNNFGTRMKAARKMLKFTLHKLSEQTGITPQHLSRLEKRTSCAISYATAKKIADALMVTTQFLLEGREFKTAAEFGTVNRQAPILLWHEAADWIRYGEKMPNAREFEYVPLADRRPQSCFSLEILNDSMMSNIERISFNIGEFIIVDPTLEPEDGKFVVCQFKNEPAPILRQLFIERGKKILRPLNTLYKMDFVNDDDDSFEILGVVIEKRIVL